MTMTHSTAPAVEHTVPTGPGGAPPVVPDVTALRACGNHERVRVIENYIRRELGRMLLVPPAHRIDTNRPLDTQGVGSIAGLWLKRRLEAVFQVELNVVTLLRAASAAELAFDLAGRIGSPPAATPAEVPPRHRPNAGAAVTA